MSGLLGRQSGGLLGSPRQVRQPPPPMPMQPSPMMGMGMAPQGPAPGADMDQLAMQQGGQGVGIWREIMRAMANNTGGSPLGFLDPKSGAISPQFQKLLKAK